MKTMLKNMTTLGVIALTALMHPLYLWPFRKGHRAAVLALALVSSVCTASVGTSAATRMWATRCVRDITTNYVGYGFTMSGATATWLPKAVLATGFTSFLVLTNATNAIQVDLQGTGPLRIDWGNGTNQSATLTSSDVGYGQTNDTSAARAIVIVGRVSRLESSYNDARSRFGGRVNTATSLTVLICYGYNTLSGTVSNLTSLTILNCSGNNTLTGWENIATNAVGMCYFQHGGLTPLTSNQVDAVLAGFVLNSSSNHSARVNRSIILNAAINQAPSAVGYGYRDFLTNTVTPGGDGRKWTVTVK